MAWGIGTSEFVKCPKCDAINRVPLECEKQYLANQKKEEKKERPAQSVPAQKGEEFIDFFDVGPIGVENSDTKPLEPPKNLEERQKELQKAAEEKARR